jgi:septin family protein
MEDIEYYGIPVYNFPYDVEEDDEDTIADNSELRSLMPFAIIGSEEEVIINGEPVRARSYPWGIVEVDNPRHSDFARLRSALLSTHLTDLKEITHDFLYENYRTEKVRWQGDVTCKFAFRLMALFLYSSHAQYTATMPIPLFLVMNLPTRVSDSRKSNFVVRKKSCEKLSSRFNEKFKKRGRNCWQRRKAFEI